MRLFFDAISTEDKTGKSIGHWLDMVYPPPPPPRGAFVDHIFLEAQCLARILQHVSPLKMAALSCTSLLHTLPYKMFFLRLQKSAEDEARFPNWLYFLSKLLLGNRY